MTEALYYDQSPKKGVNCTLCPHLCKIKEGHTGYCKVRQNVDGVLYAESYGRISSIALDPIEKKPLRFFHSGSKILSIGGYGCNFCCPFCQNYEISMSKPSTENMSPPNLVQAARHFKAKGNIGIAYTYNEPMIAFEYVLDCAKQCRSEGLLNVAVTNGYISKEPLEELLPFIDAMNIDLKSYSSAFYRRIGGELERVKDTIRVASQACHVEITTLVIPDENDSEYEMESLAGWLASVNENIPLHLTGFYPRYKMTDKPPTASIKIHALRKIAAKHLRHVCI